MNHSNASSSLTLIAAASLAVAAALPLEARAQDYGAMLQRSLADSAQLSQTMAEAMRRSQAESAQMGRTMAQAQHDLIQQAMQNPQVRAGYEQYVVQMRQSGGQAMDLAQYAYYYIYTRGFTDMEHMKRVEGANGAAEMDRVRGLRGAEGASAEALRANRDGYSRNFGEVGLGLMGQSTYYGQGGASYQLPHTWQNNSYHTHQGNSYYVDPSGQYYRLDANGWRYLISR